MPKAMMLVWSNPSDPARDDEFNKWYNSTHAPDMLKLAPFKSVKRYRMSGTQLAPVETPGQYVAIYEIETDDLGAIPQVLGEAFAAGELPMDDVLVPGDLIIFEPASDEITR